MSTHFLCGLFLTFFSVSERNGCIRVTHSFGEVIRAPRLVLRYRFVCINWVSSLLVIFLPLSALIFRATHLVRFCVDHSSTQSAPIASFTSQPRRLF